MRQIKFNTLTYQNDHPQKVFDKDVSMVKPGFKSVPLQFHFEIAGLASDKKWREIQNMAGEERF